MSRTIHLSNGIIITDPVFGANRHSITIVDGIVADHNGEIPEDAEHIDLQGKCAVPSFIDSHLHLTLAATGMGEADLRTCNTKSTFQSKLHSAITRLEKGQWLVGSGWSEVLLREMPDRTWFSESLSMPVVCYRTDFHCAVVNGALLKLIDTERLRKMPGGQRVHDGIIMEDALFDGLLPLVPKCSADVLVKRTEQAIKKLHSKGITLIGTMEKKTDIDSVLVPLQQTQAIRMRVMCHDEPTPQMIASCDDVLQDEFLQITGFKTFLDGTLGSRTAKMYTDWCDVAGSGGWTGHAARGELKAWVNTVAGAGYAPVLHAIGDEAVGLALQVLKSVEPQLAARIEHAQCISETDIDSVEKQFFGVQPLHQPDDFRIANQALGKTRIGELHNWRRMLDASGILSFGSDWPIAQPDPIAAMAVAIECGLTEQEALVASTTDAAKSLREADAGRLCLGSYGDIAILDRDPLVCDWKETTPSVTMTIQAGKIVYTKE